MTDSPHSAQMNSGPWTLVTLPDMDSNHDWRVQGPLSCH